MPICLYIGCIAQQNSPYSIFNDMKQRKAAKLYICEDGTREYLSVFLAALDTLFSALTT